MRLLVSDESRVCCVQRFAHRTLQPGTDVVSHEHVVLQFTRKSEMLLAGDARRRRGVRHTAVVAEALVLVQGP